MDALILSVFLDKIYHISHCNLTAFDILRYSKVCHRDIEINVNAFASNLILSVES
ncbi:hypothetical protein P618_200029 [Holospora obtusa F1]|uniref:Uncharacterized protein n=1 Tax=Holospora obtusa F1 TaxID=1399147 RepID=W6TEL3_HOLOB|nr:hypothetical protein P618_200029 [Holospora obtusa F1]